MEKLINLENGTAKYFCQKYHYSKTMPTSSTYKFGFIENDELIGIIAYSVGSNNNLKGFLKLNDGEFLELVRCAFKKHQKQLTYYIKKSVDYIKKNNDKIKVIISYSDSLQSHNGVIYKAFGFDYIGKTGAPKMFYDLKNQKYMHPRTIRNWELKLIDKFGYNKQQFKKHMAENGYEERKTAFKRRWIFFINKKYKRSYIKTEKYLKLKNEKF